MKVLEYNGLDTSRVASAYRKVKEAIARGDFRAAQVKKLVHPGHGKFYRARLDEADRLIFSLVRHGEEVRGRSLAQLSQLVPRTAAMCLILREANSEGLHYAASGRGEARDS